MAGQILWGRFALFTGLIMAGGYGIMKVSTPNEEQFYNSLAPDLKRKVDAIRAQRATSEEMRDKLQAAAGQDKIVWADGSGSEAAAAPGRENSGKKIS